MESEHFVGKVAIRGLIHKDGKILLTRHPLDTTFGFPGGRLDIEEDPKACLIREVQEELGVSVEPKSVVDAGITTYDNGTRHFYVIYEVELKDATLIPNPEEVAECRWIGAPQIANQEVYPSCKLALADYFSSQRLG